MPHSRRAGRERCPGVAPRPRSLPLDDAAGLVEVVRHRARAVGGQCVVALDGRSGSGKSTLAAELGARLDALVIEGDAFFSGGVEVRRDTPEERARACIDWRRQRPVLQALRAGQGASYLAFDWGAFDGRLLAEPSRVEPRPIIILEGVYSARPELDDVIDLRVLLRVTEATRTARLLAREGRLSAWERQWHEAEDWYFAHLAPPQQFDVIMDE